MFNEMSNEEMMKCDGGGRISDCIPMFKLIKTCVKITKFTSKISRPARNVHRGGKIYHVSAYTPK
ncbi:hypothetical protein [Helicovermis profundi]|uniref:Bacteriocin n=1 Tax=Helicovermis profundi TaxID=3065157 RepID=A0AAU9E405_9FIRM|nr:hypothetical protein HLPR_16500 [Clostridia bacterium S502]